MSGPTNKVVSKDGVEPLGDLADELGPGIFEVAIVEGSEPRLFRADGTAVRFFEGIVPIVQPRGGRSVVIGTGFWLHKYGVLGTARHVLAELWDKNARKLLPAYVLDARLDPTTGALTSRLRMIRHVAVAVDEVSADVGVALVDHLETGSSHVLANNYFAYTEDHPSLGSTLFSYGYPGNEEIHVPGQGIRGKLVEGPYVEYLKPGDYRCPYPLFRAHMRIEPGASGSPIFDLDGRVCAIASSGITDDPNDTETPVPVSHPLPMGSFLDLELTELTRTRTTLRDVLANR